VVRKLLAPWVILLMVGCAQPPPPTPPPVAAVPAPAEPEHFVHHIEWPGQTLGEIARWYTGKFENWKKLAKPVNPDLERCCVRLRVGREVSIPRELLVRTEPMPKTVTRPSKPLVKAGAGTAAEAKAEVGKAEEMKAEEPQEKEDKEDKEEEAEAAEEAPAVAEAPTASAGAESSAAPPAVIAEAPPRRGAAASGTVDFKGSSWSVADAIAYPADENTIEVALSNKPFDRKEFVKDGKIDSFDIMHHQMDAHASSVTLKIQGNGSLSCIDYQLEAGGGSSCGTTQSQALKLAKKTDDAIGGTFSYHDGADKIDVRFDLPITREAKRSGSALPAGGGAPGTAVLAHFAAMRTGDFEKLKAVSSPDKRKEMESTKMEESDKKAMLEFLKAMAASDVKILGGTIDGDTALVDYQGKRDGESVKGTAEVKQVGGKWYVESDTSR
jgi:hypothetical protein